MKLKLVLVMGLLLVSSPLFAESARQIPPLLNYQGSLIDEGGNPLADGSANLKFQILNSAGGVVYEESQDLDVVKGQVSAIVGNGLNVENNGPTGGIPAEVLDPTDRYYLQVEVAGQKPYDPLELVAVPYATWADTALRMPMGAITGDMIGKGVITKEHLNEELINAIFPNGIPKEMLPSDTVYSGDFKNFSNTIQSPAGAGRVGVNGGLVYSGSQTVQGVLKDLDLAIKKRQEEVEFSGKDYVKRAGDEETARTTADTTLQTNITTEAGTRSSADATLQANIDAEATTRGNADTTLQTNITTEAGTRSSADATLQSNISTKVSKSGDTMSGILNMGSERIENLGSPNSGDDAMSRNASDGLYIKREYGIPIRAAAYITPLCGVNTGYNISGCSLDTKTGFYTITIATAATTFWPPFAGTCYAKNTNDNGYYLTFSGINAGGVVVACRNEWGDAVTDRYFTFILVSDPY